jgi:methylenetetrahydrofolate dehydrogenase (NADP+)/methenyltetrahydrofolate cyclohydrolase
MELIRRYNIEVRGKRCVVIGRSNIVGKPMARLLLQADGTVTVCHSRTENLADITREADVLVVAAGRRGFVTGEMIKPGAAVFDVGIHRENGRVYGDVDFVSAEPVAGYITPVPGGVGPMTIAMLMKNCLSALTLQNGRNGK